MRIPDEFLYEYAVVRYVPRVDREEFINIGLIMMCKRRKWLRGEIKLNAERIKTFYPYADLECISKQAEVFMRKDVPAADLPIEEKYRWLAAVKSATLQVSQSHPGLLSVNKQPTAEANDNLSASEAIELLDKEFDRLFTDLVS